MSKPQSKTGNKNIIASRLKELRERDNLSQRQLARKMQLIGCDVDKNVITRIEMNNRYVCDFELKAIAQIFHVPYEYLLDASEKEQ